MSEDSKPAEKPKRLMRCMKSHADRFLRSIATAIVSGIVCLFVAFLVLTHLGEKYHGSYEYYGKYPALFWIPGVVGFLLPSLLAWVIRKVRCRKDE